LEPDPFSAFIISLHLKARYYERKEKDPGPLIIV
jgi:hypothetical protein